MADYVLACRTCRVYWPLSQAWPLFGVTDVSFPEHTALLQDSPQVLELMAAVAWFMTTHRWHETAALENGEAHAAGVDPLQGWSHAKREEPGVSDVA